MRARLSNGIVDTMGRARSWAGPIGAVGLLASVVTLAAAFLQTVDSASFHFRRATIAQAQFAAVLRIEGRITARNPDPAALDADLAGYAALVARETILLPTGDGLAQASEAREAAALAELAADPRAQGRLLPLVANVIAREKAEAADALREMETLRRRTRWIATLLAGVATGSALLGAAGLVAANRRLSRQVVARTAELIGIDASRRLFFAKASHELRTPVTVMRGEAEVTLADVVAPPAALRDALHHVVAQAEFLEHRIAELLGLAQAEGGQIVLAQAPFDLADACGAAAKTTAGFARSLEVEVAVTTSPSPIVGDRRWIEQAIVAILDNAIKFSPTGDIVTIALTVVRAEVSVAITDHGAGVAAAALPRLFDAYYQTETGRARGGSGLGLALARWVVEQHRGNITAANLDGGGCRVTLTLPTA